MEPEVFVSTLFFMVLKRQLVNVRFIEDPDRRRQVIERILAELEELKD
jgi:hypothetical protein